MHTAEGEPQHLVHTGIKHVRNNRLELITDSIKELSDTYRFFADKDELVNHNVCTHNQIVQKEWNGEGV